jgi:hypothetical protein
MEEDEVVECVECHAEAATDDAGDLDLTGWEAGEYGGWRCPECAYLNPTRPGGGLEALAEVVEAKREGK